MSNSDPQQQTTPDQKIHTFNHPWTTVVLAFFDKYPTPDLSFIKYNKVIDISLTPDNKLLVKRIQKFEKFRYLWAYNTEELLFDFQNKIMDLKTIPLKVCKFIPLSGEEIIQYRGIMEDTLYIKNLNIKGKVGKWMDKFNSSFKKGVEVVEKNCKKIREVGLDEWVNGLMNWDKDEELSEE